MQDPPETACAVCACSHTTNAAGECLEEAQKLLHEHWANKRRLTLKESKHILVLITAALIYARESHELLQVTEHAGPLINLNPN
jgi:hypothetical protein